MICKVNYFKIFQILYFNVPIHHFKKTTTLRFRRASFPSSTGIKNVDRDHIIPGSWVLHYCHKLPPTCRLLPIPQSSLLRLQNAISSHSLGKNNRYYVLLSVFTFSITRKSPLYYHQIKLSFLEKGRFKLCII